MPIHHLSIRTGNIHRSMAFYECLGFAVEERFTTGMTLACWLVGPAGRLELIQVPLPRPAADAFGDEHYVGYYHLSLEVAEPLTVVLERLSAALAAHDQQIDVLLPPQPQTIGPQTYEIAFIRDPDGLPLEFLYPLGPAGGGHG